MRKFIVLILIIIMTKSLSQDLYENVDLAISDDYNFTQNAYKKLLKSILFLKHVIIITL